jgi:hypothetical protein
MWLLIEDQDISMKLSHFMRRKGKIIKNVMHFMKSLKAQDPNKVKYIHLDNAGKNLGLKTNLENEGIDTFLEFTSPETPEQNGHVKQSLAMLWGLVRAIMNHSGVIQDLRDELWAEYSATATKLSNVMSQKKGKSPFEYFYGHEAKLAKNLLIFEEVGRKLSNLYGLSKKIAHKGNHCLILGYESNHLHDTFRVLNLKKKLVMVTRNVR